jgi:preprotein translocase subunit SecG
MFFGNLFVYFQFQGKTLIDADTRRSVFIVLLVIAAIGIVFLLLLRPAQSADGEMVRKDEGGPLNALRRAFSLLITKEMVLLSITFFYTGKLTYGKYDLNLSWLLNAIKLARAASHVKWLKTDETNISRTISVLVLRELKKRWFHQFLTT